MNPNLVAAAIQYYRAGRIAEAEGICKQILRNLPGNSEILGHLCKSLHRLDQVLEALKWAAAGVDEHPEVAELHANLGEISRSAGKLAESVAAFKRAIELKPLNIDFHGALAGAFHELRKYESAAHEYQRVIELRPDDASAYTNLAIELLQLNRVDDAMNTIRKALMLQPRDALCHINLALVLTEQGKYQEAVEAYTRAIEIDPNSAHAHCFRAQLHLLLGDWDQGWKEYEWRSEITRNLHPKRWNGQPISGKTILLFGEAGFGDTIQFARYVPMVANLGARIIFACEKKLIRLMERLPGISQIIPRDQCPKSFDFFCPTMSLPLAFGTTLENVPASVPYLRVSSPQHSEQQSTQGPLRVGLVWAGNPGHWNDPKRSISFHELAPLWDIKGLEFHNLQIGSAVNDAQEFIARRQLIDQTSNIQDFHDTAVLIQQLDLVIAVDTSVAHLAGALAKPVWVLLPFSPEWRWLIDRGDSPWYPTMRLFRQTTGGDWPGVICKVSEALTYWVTAHGRKLSKL
jgi:tetratricopeptide (TPR) repeat protein